MSVSEATPSPKQEQLPAVGQLTQEKRRVGSVRRENLVLKGLISLLLAAGAVIIMTPILWMISASLKDVNQIRQRSMTLLPLKYTLVEVNGEQEPLYQVTVDGETRQMALIRNRPEGMGIFVDPQNPQEEHLLKIDEQLQLEHVELHPENYANALTKAPFDTYLLNTLLVTFLGMAGMLFSCSLVAYGFSRFRAPGINILFLLLLSTIMLPRQVTLIPLYVLFSKIGWVNSLLPLIVPQFFANAYDVFLLRQFFMTIPLSMDDAARIDGANPLQVLWYIILPQARPALVAVGIFHFIYAWNDFYEPLIFLHSQEKWTLAVGLQSFNAVYTINTHEIMAVSLLMIIPPIIIFFLSQRIFTQGVVISGVKG